MIRNGIPRVFCSAEQPEFRRNKPIVPSIPSSAEQFFCRKLPTLVYIGARVLHVLNLIWFGSIARLFQWGGWGYFPCLNDFYLPCYTYMKVGGRHPVVTVLYFYGKRRQFSRKLHWIHFPEKHTIAVYAPMIYTAPSVMLLIRAAYIRRASGRGFGPGNRDFFEPC